MSRETVLPPDRQYSQVLKVAPRSCKAVIDTRQFVPRPFLLVLTLALRRVFAHGEHFLSSSQDAQEAWRWDNEASPCSVRRGDPTVITTSLLGGWVRKKVRKVRKVEAVSFSPLSWKTELGISLEGGFIGIFHS